MTTVIMADDSGLMRTILKNFLKKAGCEVVGEAADGAAIVDVYKEKKPNLVFLDILMPGTDGISALREIKKINPLAKVVMCSSVLNEKTKAETKALGAKIYITKPFRGDDINNAVKTLSG